MAATRSEVESIFDDTSATTSTNILFCGSDLSPDETKIIFDNIGAFSKEKRFPVLATFLSRSEDVLKQEIALLAHADQKHIPPFHNVLSIAACRSKAPHVPLSGALDSALHCILQLGVFIICHENLTAKSKPFAELSILAGLSIGLLSAAAISVSKSWWDLASAGSESVRVAFRLGLHVEKTSQNLEQIDMDGQLQSWAYVIANMALADVQNELDLLEHHGVNSALNKVFAKTAGQLLEEIVTEILTGTIFLDNLSKGLSNTISNSATCSLMYFGSSAVSRALVSSIEDASVQIELKQADLTSFINTISGLRQPSSFDNDKLAIVGMSCRLPGGANNNELFWKLMMEGRDKVSRDPTIGLEAHDSPWTTSSIHQITLETGNESRAKLLAISNLKSSSLFPAVQGHQMNGYGVATTVSAYDLSHNYILTNLQQSIWADMALSIGEYLFRQTRKVTGEIHMNISNMDVLHAQVISDSLNTSHLIKIEAELDIVSRRTFVRWYSLSSSEPTKSFATCTVEYEDPTSWAQEWAHMTHLIQDRVDELTRLAHMVVANSINRNMAYTLFKNVVDYADKYRGMHSVIMPE
ncbi:hypothetical protein NHQ30_002298 [Ciborinia camelliae]|nr:hypothetical protein NHQ30_002298 [Ciborinia camelliae]